MEEQTFDSSSLNSERFRVLRHENEEYQNLYLLLQDEVSRLMYQNEDDLAYHQDKMRVKQDQIDLLNERMAKLCEESARMKNSLASVYQKLCLFLMEFSSIRQLLRHVAILVQTPVELPVALEDVIRKSSKFDNFILYASAENERSRLRQALMDKEFQVKELQHNLSSFRDPSLNSGKKRRNSSTLGSCKTETFLDANAYLRLDQLEMRLLEQQQRNMELENEAQQLRELSAAYAKKIRDAENSNTVTQTAEKALQAAFDVDYTKMQEYAVELHEMKQEVLLIRNNSISQQEEAQRAANELAAFRLKECAQFAYYSLNLVEKAKDAEQTIADLQKALGERDAQLAQMLRRSRTESQVELGVQVYRLTEERDALIETKRLLLENLDEKQRILECQRTKHNALLEELQGALRSMEAARNARKELQPLVDVASNLFPELQSHSAQVWKTVFGGLQYNAQRYYKIFADNEESRFKARALAGEIDYLKRETTYLQTQLRRARQERENSDAVYQLKVRELEQAEHKLQLVELECDQLKDSLRALQNEHYHYRKMQALAFDNIKTYYEKQNVRPIEQKPEKKDLELSLRMLASSRRAPLKQQLFDEAIQAESQEERASFSQSKINEHLRAQLSNERKRCATITRRLAQSSDADGRQPCGPGRKQESLRSHLKCVLYGGRGPVYLENLSINREIIEDRQLAADVRAEAATEFVRGLKDIIY